MSSGVPSFSRISGKVVLPGMMNAKSSALIGSLIVTLCHSIGAPQEESTRSIASEASKRSIHLRPLRTVSLLVTERPDLEINGTLRLTEDHIVHHPCLSVRRPTTRHGRGRLSPLH